MPLDLHSSSWEAFGWDPQTLARLEEGRQARGTAEVAPDRIEVGGGWACAAEPGSWLNLAAGLGLSGPVSDEELDRLIAFYEERGLEACVEIAAHADPALAPALSARGFRIREFEHVLARPAGQDSGEVATTPGLSIERVPRGDEAGIEALAKLSTGVFFGPQAAEDPTSPARLAAEAVARHERVDSYLARLGGRVVGAAQLEVLGEVACLIGAAVIPAARRRGVQRGLTLARLSRAQALGARWVCVHSAPGGPTERGARRLGFRLAYAKAVLVRPLGG